MKAVVLAGGFGTRIQPLASGIPKPMLPLMNMPILELILGRLEKLEVDEIALLLYFMPEKIRDYFQEHWQGNAKLTFIVPDADYGTAGSIRFAMKAIKETTLVISGDLVTDIDLKAAVDFHSKSAAVATIVLTSVTNPLQFGVVIADERGRIRSFLEKPGWGEVVSDTVNTGIYVLEPEVLRMIPKGKSYDFSRDLFPRLLKNGKALYGYTASGYWRDVGNPESYRSVHRDIFSGKTRIPLPGTRTEAGEGVAWLSDGASLSRGAHIKGWVVAGPGVHLPRGRYQNSVFGQGCEISPDSVIDSSILWSGVSVGGRSRISNAVVCDKVRLGEGTYIPEGAVIASDCVLEDGVSVEKDVLLWPGKKVEAGSVLTSNLIWGDRWKAEIFEGNIVSGHTNVEMNSGFTAKLGEAFGSLFPESGRILVSRDGHRASRMLKRAFLGGVLSTGVSVSDLRSMPVTVTRYKLTTFGEVGGAHFRQKPGDESSTEILFFNKDGFAISEELARDTERIFFREKFRRSQYDRIGGISEQPIAVDYYREGFLRAVDPALFRERAFKVVIDLAHGSTSQILPDLLGDLECEAVILNAHPDERKSAETPDFIREALDRVGKIVRTLGADMGFYLTPDGERLFMVDERGKSHPSFRTLLYVMHLLGRTAGRGKARVFLPVQAPHIAAGHIKKVKVDSGRLSRLPQEACDSYDLVAGVDGSYAFPGFQPHRDAMFALVKILQLTAAAGRNASEIYDTLPLTYYHTRTTICPSDIKGRLLRNFREAMADHDLYYTDGVKAVKDGSWILLLPDVHNPRVSLTIESEDRQAAQRLMAKWGRRLSRWALER